MKPAASAPETDLAEKRWAEWAIRIFAFLFFTGAVTLALFVTPLWDVPDESGHYGIVQDLADGKGLPLPGRSKLPENVLRDWMRVRSPEPMDNWAAQHPPLYHLLATPFLAGARTITRDPRWLFRAPRLLSALCGAAALLVFFRAFRAAGADPTLAVFSAAAIGLVPMYLHMASGTNHDIFVALLAGFAALFWVRLLASGSTADGLKMAAALGLMGLTKVSAVPVTVVLLALAVRPLAARGPRKLVAMGALTAVALAPPAAWAVRQWILLGNLQLHPVSPTPFDLLSFLSYLHDYPVVDHTFKNFAGLIGWTGSGGGELRWLQISGPFLAVFLVLGLAAAGGTAFSLLLRDLAERRFFSIDKAGLVFAVCILWLFATADGSPAPKRVLYGLLVAAPILALGAAFSRPNPDSAVLGSHAVYFFFGLAYLVNSWEGYEIYGQMRATHGRYFFAVLPFLVIGFIFPAARLLRDRRRRDLVLAVCAAFLVLDEAAFFLFRVIPFYRSGPFAR